MYNKIPPCFSRWIEIDLDRIANNISKIKQKLASQTKLMAVVKADAYGHGAKEVSKISEQQGADYLGVSILEEGLTLRKAEIKIPILVFTPLLPFQYLPAIENNLTLTLCDLKGIKELNKIGEQKRKKINLHLKVDAGMGRLGIDPKSVINSIRKIASFPNLSVEGIYTHLAYLYGRDRKEIENQFRKFKKILNDLTEEEISIPFKHIANSSVFLDFPYMQLDMVRIGNLIYGFIPLSRKKQLKLNLDNPWKFKTRIIQTKKIAKGSWIGYGKESYARNNLKVAIIPVGFFEGLSLFPSSVKNRIPKIYVEVKGYILPLIGRISMQLAVIDINQAPEIKVGDDVSLNIRRTSTNSCIPRIYRYKGKNRIPDDKELGS